MKNWKKLLNEQLDAEAPALKKEILDAPILTDRNRASDEVLKSGNSLIKAKTGIFAACGAAVLALIFALLCILGAFNNVNAPANGLIFTLEINPAVAFSTDETGKVLSVNALNADADVILSDERTLNKIKNVPLSQAIVAYTDCAAKLGYIDLNATKTAVRLCSPAEGGSTGDEAAESLQTYFKSKGVFAAVVQSPLDLTALSESTGITDAKNASEMAKKLGALPEKHGERLSESDLNDLQTLYQTYIMGENTLEYVRNELTQNLTSIVSNAVLLSKLTLRNYEITLNAKNPIFLGDYWKVKQSGKAYDDADFANSMNEMQTLLSEYEEEFGVAIKSGEELTKAAEVYSEFSKIDLAVELAQFVTDLSLSNFSQVIEKISGMFENVGSDVSALKSLLSAPQTAQEYFSQLQISLSQTFSLKLQSYRETYEQVRAQISDENYDDFIDGILQEYGSLENFWKNK